MKELSQVEVKMVSGGSMGALLKLLGGLISTTVTKNAGAVAKYGAGIVKKAGEGVAIGAGATATNELIKNQINGNKKP
ncbi:hypothetical protein C2M02_23540 [Serratia marcescens subsp. marcescens ATCC 13880]|nr:hypothetical protein [Serratia marcescens]PNU42427.1 hypothetical protein C2M02_23540 [Serratia marcescens subsp. marcescens ATCC 13880]